MLEDKILTLSQKNHIKNHIFLFPPLKKNFTTNWMSLPRQPSFLSTLATARRYLRQHWKESTDMKSSMLCLCMHVQLLQSYQILCYPVDCSPPGNSVHGISQVRILEWAAMPASRRSSWSRDWTRVSCGSCISFPIDLFTFWAIRKTPSVIPLC